MREAGGAVSGECGGAGEGGGLEVGGRRLRAEEELINCGAVPRQLLRVVLDHLVLGLGRELPGLVQVRLVLLEAERLELRAGGSGLACERGLGCASRSLPWFSGVQGRGVLTFRLFCIQSITG